jgi:general secretion pathway protein G
MKIKKYSSGFSLIELLVVISIMAVLISLSAFGLQQARESARDGQRKADLETIRTGLSFYKSDCNVYPTEAASTTKMGTVLTASCITPTPVYIEKMPTDPVSGRNYIYVRSTSGYRICASLETEVDADSNCSTVSCGTTCNYSVTNP